MKKAKKGVTHDYNDCTQVACEQALFELSFTQPEISKRGTLHVFGKKTTKFGKISAQRLVITAEKVWSHYT